MSRSIQSAINRRAGGQQQTPPQQMPRQTVGISSQQMFQQQQQRQPMQGQPMQGQPMQGQPMQGQPMQGQPMQGQPMQGQQMYNQQQEPSIKGQVSNGKKGKITISDAIALTTLRLGRLEVIVDKMNSDGLPVRGDIEGENSEYLNSSRVDNSVIMSLISRIELLEKRPSQSTTSNTSNSDSKLIDEKISQVKSDLSLLKNEINSIKNDIIQIKDNAMKLQMFTMETNQKLVSAVMTQPQLISSTQNNNIVETIIPSQTHIYDPNVIQESDNNSSRLEENTTYISDDVLNLDKSSISVNLKEYIEQELKQPINF